MAFSTKSLFGNMGGLGGFGGIFRMPSNIKDDPSKEEKDSLINLTSITNPEPEDGSFVVDASHYTSSAVITETLFQSQALLINEYRTMALHSDVDNAIDDIINGMVSIEEDKDVISIDLTAVKIPDKIKQILIQENTYILQNLLNFNQTCYEKIHSWYVDGRQAFQTIINEDNPKMGIIKLVPIDARAIKKIKEIKTLPDIQTRIEKIVDERVYYVYNPNWAKELNIQPTGANFSIYNYAANIPKQTLEIPIDNVIFIHSGIFNPDRTMIFSHLEKARKPLNNLRTIEDAVVIYRITRASERRIWYVDTGTLPTKAANEYIDHIIKGQKTRMQYDINTGHINGNTIQMNIMEDIFVPRREGSRGTEIDTLPSATNLDALDDLQFFQKKLFRALNVPISRTEGETSGFLLGGRGAEISRDEWKFSCFTNRLKRRYSELFSELLKKQLILKNILTIDDWDSLIGPYIKYKWNANAYLKEQTDMEAFQAKLANLQLADQFVGKYFSKQTIFHKILQLSDDDIETEKEQMMIEIEEGEIIDPVEMEQAELAQQQADIQATKNKGRV